MTSTPREQHDLARLALRLPSAAADALLVIDLDELSRWAIEGRYPADLDEAQEADATMTTKLAGGPTRFLPFNRGDSGSRPG